MCTNGPVDFQEVTDHNYRNLHTESFMSCMHVLRLAEPSLIFLAYHNNLQPMEYLQMES